LEGHDSFGPLVRKLFDKELKLILTTSVLSLMETIVIFDSYSYQVYISDGNIQ